MAYVEQEISNDFSGISARSSREKAPEVVKRDGFVSCHGRPIWLREVSLGDRPASEHLLLVHGNTFPSRAGFDLPDPGGSFAERLAREGIGCALFDHMGYGRSHRPPPGEPMGIERRARELRAVHEHLVRERGVERVVLLGLSTGCNTIARYLESPLEGVDGLVFLGPCYLVNPFLWGLIWKMKALDAFRKLIGRGGDAYMRFDRKALEKRLIDSDDRRLSREAAERFISAALAADGKGGQHLVSPVLGFADLARSYSVWDRMFDAESIDVPLLIVRGGRDEFCCARSAESLRRDVRSAPVDLVTVEGAKHDLHLYPGTDDAFSRVLRFVQTAGRGRV